MRLTSNQYAEMAAQVAALKATDEYRGDTAGAAHHLAQETGVHIRHYLAAYRRAA